MGPIIQQSPGVGIREVDLTPYVPVQGISGGAFVGHFMWGPAYHVMTVNDENQLLKMFGKPKDENYLDWYAASDFLSYTNNLKLVRVVDTTNAKNATADSLGTLIKNEDHFNYVFGTLESAEFAAKYPGLIGNSLKVSICDSHGFDNWEYKTLFTNPPGTSDYAEQLGATNDEIHLVVVDEDGLVSNTAPGAVLEKFSFLSKALDAKNLDGSAIFYGDVINTQSNYVWYLGVPSSGSYAIEHKVDSVTVTNKGSGYSEATLTFSAPADTEHGIRATGRAIISPGVVSSVSINTAGSGYTSAPTVSFSAPTGPNGITASATAVINGSGEVTGINIINPGRGYLSVPTITISDPQETGTTATATATTSGAKIESVVITNPGSGYTHNENITLTVDGDGTGAAFTIVKGHVNNDPWATECIGSNGTPKNFSSLVTVYSKSLLGGADGSLPTKDELFLGWDLFKNSEETDVSLLFVGAAGGPENSVDVIQYVIDNVAEVRKDCVVFCSPDKDDVVNMLEPIATENVLQKRALINRSTNYGVMDSGWKLRFDKWNNKNRWTPLNPDIAGLCASTDTTNDPWWSPAGYTRGRIKNARKLAFNPSRTYRDELYKQNINPIVSFIGEGPILYGDRTMQLKPSAFSYINVRRLFIVLEKSIARAAKYQLFEFNDEFTRAQFISMVEPFLRDVKGRRGIYAYKVVCDESNNTGEIIDRAEFVADIYIKPARSINFITLNFIATKTGVDFNEAMIATSEA